MNNYKNIDYLLFVSVVNELDYLDLLAQDIIVSNNFHLTVNIIRKEISDNFDEILNNDEHLKNKFEKIKHNLNEQKNQDFNEISEFFIKLKNCNALIYLLERAQKGIDFVYETNNFKDTKFDKIKDLYSEIITRINLNKTLLHNDQNFSE